MSMDESGVRQNGLPGGSTSPKECSPSMRDRVGIGNVRGLPAGKQWESAETVLNHISGPHTIINNPENGKRELLELRKVAEALNEKEKSAETGMVMGLPYEDLTEKSQPLKDPTIKHSDPNIMLPPENEMLNSTGLHLGPSFVDTPVIQPMETARKGELENSKQLGFEGKRPRGRPRKTKSTAGPSVSTARLLRSRLHDQSNATKPVENVVEDNAVREKKRKRRKKKKNSHVNEFSRIRSHLRYLLHRIKYEQYLIDAYSGEGWKGLSLEKIKPEKELQRAESQIFRHKLKIRDLFQRLDLSLAQGRFPEYLYDSEGQIDSEDIFCAKCGSKDLATDNDIILCDGACERGFHQFCVEPPLLKEDIPPGDEGWLCPGCDCKVDCINLLNDFQGKHLSVTDSWEKVFPEEAAAASGVKLDDGSQFPSDDSEDDDYNPDKLEVDTKSSDDESSSNQSDYSMASDELVASPKSEPLLGLPSEDSEDDDYDPDNLDGDKQVRQESSSSDFTSDSEDLRAVLEDDRLPSIDQDPISSTLDSGRECSSSPRERANMCRERRHYLENELSCLWQSDEAIVSGKRHVERLDYKKLHDETYGNVSSDSSDEDYEDFGAPKRRMEKYVKNGACAPDKTGNGEDKSLNKRDSGHTARRKSQKRIKVNETDNSSSKSLRDPSGAGSSGKNHSRPAYKRLAEAVIKRLYESFKENQYPDRDLKENLAKELGLEVKQVSKWFENARHFSRKESNATESAILARTGENTPKVGENVLLVDGSCKGIGDKEPPRTHPGVKQLHVGLSEGKDTGDIVSTQEPKNLKSKRKNGNMININDETSEYISSIAEAQMQNVQDNVPNAQQVRRSSRIQTGSNKSVV